MALSESYQCDVCGAKKAETDSWWLSWVDCFTGTAPSIPSNQPMLKFTRWHVAQAHAPGVEHLCGARCAGTLMDRWMTEQHEHPESNCAP